MSVVGLKECACAELKGFPIPAPAPLWLSGQRGIRVALKTLIEYNQRRLLYSGGVHVDGIHVLSVLGDRGEILYESGLRKQSRVLGRVHTIQELEVMGLDPADW